MCNRYHVPGDEYEPQFVGETPFGREPRKIGPFQTGRFIRPGPDGPVDVVAQWGMIRPGSKTRRPGSRAILTNNARSETVAKLPTYRDAWAAGQRCLVPAISYDEPNWETKKNIWWSMRRADGALWALAGLWSEWTDPETGELVPNYTLVTVNCDGHPLLARLHKPDPKLPDNEQDKRSLVPLEADQWEQWLHGTEADARALLRTPPVEVYDLSDAHRTDALLAQMALRPASLF